MEGFAVVIALMGIFNMIFWMVMGARAVRAHELLANHVGRMAASTHSHRSDAAGE